MFARRRFLFAVVAACLLLGLWAPFSGSDSRRPFQFLSRSNDSKASKQTAVSHSRSTTAAGPADDLTAVRKFEYGLRTPRGRIDDEWTRRWRALVTERRTIARDEDMETFIEELAATDPGRAVALAQSEPDSELRLELFQSALRGWGGADPEAAMAWAASQTLLDQSQAMAAVFHGVARDPELALKLTAKFSQEDPARAHDYGSYLVAALSRIGEFNEAAAFAAKGLPGARTDWLNAVFSRWADSEPKAALQQVAQWTESELHRTAFDVAVSHWAKNDAQALAEYSLTLRDGRDRTFALSAALRQWAAASPAEAAAWMNRFEPSAEFDFGMAVVASQPEALRQPQIAAGWAESIVDSRLRVRTLATLVHEWAATDPVAARHYAETTTGIRSEDRAGVLAAFEPGFKQVSLLP